MNEIRREAKHMGAVPKLWENLSNRDKVSIEKSIIQSVCPRCDECVGLNCGDKEEDIYIYMNPNLDERYYIY